MADICPNFGRGRDNIRTAEFAGCGGPPSQADLWKGSALLLVPEVLLASNSMKADMFIPRPLLAETGVPKVGKNLVA